MITAARCFYEITCDTTDLMQLCMSYISMANPWDWAIGDFQSGGIGWMDVEQVLKCNQFLSEVNQYMPIKRSGVIRMVPMQYYSLHTDANRGVSVNMLIQNEHSHCMFMDSTPTRTQMLELEYQIGVLYLFNTQIPHTVLNFSGIRYLFTIEFQEPKHMLSFNRALRYIKSFQKNTHPDS